MQDLSRYLSTAGMCLVVAGILRSVYRILMRRDVLLKNEGRRMAQTAFTLALMAGGCVLYGAVYTAILAYPWRGVMLFSTSLIFFLILDWLYRQMDGMKERALEVLENLVGAIEAGDPNLGGHSLHVQLLTMLLYENMPVLDRARINPDNLRYAALLLDIGKMGLPRSIAGKGGKLEPEERELMRRHPEISVEILRPIRSFGTIARWIQFHHERVDGSGYYRLRGSQIPLASRLMAVADTYSALTMERTYKAFLPYEEAVTELRQAAGTQLDPELVDAFCAIPPRKIALCADAVRQKMRRYQSWHLRREEGGV